MQEMIGRVVGSYEIRERVGEGGMGTVYRALDVMLEREVAIKAIRPELARDGSIVERFRSEARTLARVDHPNVATIYSFFREGDELFLAMEFVRGTSLVKRLREGGAIPWRQAITLMAAALEGIERAHRLGIVHRDLKPDNLMLTEAGGVKVMDFGIARAMGSTRLTTHGMLVGTVRYMSPEQVRGEEADPRSDLYALGLVLYEMLTGRLPWNATSDYALLRAQVEEEAPPPSSLAPAVPPPLDAIVLKALAKERAERYGSAAEMRAALLGAVAPAAEVAVAAPAPPVAPAVEGPTRVLSDPQAVAAPTAATLPRRQGSTPIPAAAASAGQEAQGSYRPWPADRPATRRRILPLAAGGLAVLLGVAVATGLLSRRAGEAPAVPDEATTESAEGALSPTPAYEPPAAPPGEEPAEPGATAAPAGREPRAVPIVPPARPPAAARAEPAPPTQPAPAPPTLPEPPLPEPTAPADAPTEEPATAEAGEVELDLGGVASRLAAESPGLYAAFEEYTERDDRPEALEDVESELLDALEVFEDASARFNKVFKEGGVLGRLRKRRGEAGKEQALMQRARDLTAAAEQVDRLMSRAQPSAEIQGRWNALAGDLRRVAAAGGR